MCCMCSVHDAGGVGVQSTPVLTTALITPLKGRLALRSSSQPFLRAPILKLCQISVSDESQNCLPSTSQCFSQATKYHIHVSLNPKQLARVKVWRPSKLIFFSLTDDQGYADVGFTNPSCPFVTPNIDALAASAVRLTDYYVHPTCTPTRAALLTGRSIFTRNQHANKKHPPKKIVPWYITNPDHKQSPIHVEKHSGMQPTSAFLWHLSLEGEIRLRPHFLTSTSLF